MSYSDNEHYKNNWSVRFSGSMYEKLYEWIQNNKDSMEEIHKFSTWQKVFDEIGGTYESCLLYTSALSFTQKLTESIAVEMSAINTNHPVVRCV